MWGKAIYLVRCLISTVVGVEEGCVTREGSIAY